MTGTVSRRMENGIVLATCSGALGLEDAHKGAQAVWDNPEWNGKPIVWDFRSAYCISVHRRFAEWPSSSLNVNPRRHPRWRS